MAKRLVILTLVLVMSLAAALPARAQGGGVPLFATRFEVYLTAVEIVSEGLGMDPVDLMSKLVVEETSMAQIIADEGVDAEDIAATLMEVLNIDHDAAIQFLESVYPVATPEMVFGDTGLAFPETDVPTTEIITRLILMIAMQGDLSIADIREKMESGETLNDIALEAGLDPNALVMALSEDIANKDTRFRATEGVRVVEDPGGLNQSVSIVMNTTSDGLRERFRRSVVVNLVVVGVIADELGVTRLDVRLTLLPTETLAEYITRSGGSVENVQAAAAEELSAALEKLAADGLISEKDADLMIKNAGIAVENILNALLRQSPVDVFELLDEVEE